MKKPYMGKYVKTFEDYHQFNTNDDEWHRSNDFTEDDEIQIRNFALNKNYELDSIIGIGFGGVAFNIINHKDKILKYTYDDMEVGACDFLEGKKTKYFADVYEIFEFDGAWIIILERLDNLDVNIIKDLQSISLKYDNNKSTEFNFDSLKYDSDFKNSLSNNQQKLYDDILNIKQEAYNLKFDLIDCKIDNLGLKNSHLAMFDVKHSGKNLL